MKKLDAGDAARVAWRPQLRAEVHYARRWCASNWKASVPNVGLADSEAHSLFCRRSTAKIWAWVSGNSAHAGHAE